MMMIITVWTLFLISCGKQDASSRSNLESDSGINAMPYADLVTEIKNLTAQHEEIAQQIIYGKSLEQRDLLLLKIGRTMAGNQPRPAVLITEATHGNERLNLGDRFPRRFLEDLAKAEPTYQGLKRFIDAGGVIYIIPIFNPDGYENRTRQNKGGVDLNRNYPNLGDKLNGGFTEPETRAIGAFVQKEADKQIQLKLSLDYHCCGGMILYPWSHQSQNQEAPKDLPTFRYIANELMRENLNENYKIGTPLETVGYEAANTSMDYYYIKYGTFAFGFEGFRGIENMRIDRHLTMWDQILDYMADEWSRIR